MPHPRGEDWLDDEIRGLFHDGVTVLVSLLEPAEVRSLGLEREDELCKNNGMEFMSFPIPDRGTPSSIDRTVKLAETVVERLTAGKTVAIQCRSGIGRAALIAACVAVYEGLSPHMALHTIAQARGLEVPDTPEQAEWLERFAERLAEHE